MIIEASNRFVFTEVARMLKEQCGGKPEFVDTVFIMGHVDPRCTLEGMRKKYPKKKLVLYQLEQMYNGCKYANKHVFDWLKGADEIWDYDLDNIEWLAKKGFQASFHPMHYASTLRDVPNVEKDVDVLFYGYLTERRAKLLPQIANAGAGKWSVASVMGISGKSLAQWIGRSKVILNIHAYDGNNRQEQVRMFYPVINGACVVSEQSARNYLEGCITECPLKYLSETIDNIIMNNMWTKLGENATFNFMRR